MSYNYDDILSHHLTSQPLSDKYPKPGRSSPTSSSNSSSSYRKKSKRTSHKKRSRSRSRSRSNPRHRHKRDRKRRHRHRHRSRHKHHQHHRDGDGERDRDRERDREKERKEFSKKVEEELKAKEIEIKQQKWACLEAANKRKERLKRLQKAREKKKKTAIPIAVAVESPNTDITDSTATAIKEAEEAEAEEAELYDIFAQNDKCDENDINYKVNRDNNFNITSNLSHNWDDSEGYYVVVPGDLILGKYVVLGIGGKGVYSSVLRVEEQNGEKQEYIIKVIRNNEHMKKQGLREIALLTEIGAVCCSNIIWLHDSFWYRNHLCLLFESMKCDLRRLLKNINISFGGLSICAVYQYSKQLLSALCVLNKLNLIHADIKPDNILVSGDYRNVKLCDFGSSYKLCEVDISGTIGSRYYRAPEIMLGCKWAFPVDVWSLACSLFEIYCTHFLFKGSDNNEMLLNIVNLCCLDKNILLQYKTGMFYTSHFNANGDFLENKYDAVAQFDIQIPHKLYLNNNHNKNNQKIKILYNKLQSNNNSNIQIKLNYNEKIKLNQFADLLSKMLNLNTNKRITPKQALKHPFCSEPIIATTNRVTQQQETNNNKQSKLK